MIYAGGAKFLLLSALLYAPGTALFIMARREQRRLLLAPVEWLLFGAILIAAAVGLYGLAAARFRSSRLSSHLRQGCSLIGISVDHLIS